MVFYATYSVSCLVLWKESIIVTPISKQLYVSLQSATILSSITPLWKDQEFSLEAACWAQQRDCDNVTMLFLGVCKIETCVKVQRNYRRMYLSSLVSRPVPNWVWMCPCTVNLNLSRIAGSLFYPYCHLCHQLLTCWRHLITLNF